MKLYDLPQDMQEDIKKLATQHIINTDEALEYYMMGGYTHADYLCGLRDKGITKEVIYLVNSEIWEQKNKVIWEEFRKINKTKLQQAWEDFITTIAEALKFDVFMNWLVKKLDRKE
jgi:hypothetical protein